MTEVQKPQQMQLSSLMDLLRLVVSIISRGAGGAYLYYAEHNGKHIYFLTHTVGGWYDLKGLPITLVAEHDTAPLKPFISYTYADEGQVEDYQFVDHVRQSTNSVHIPIIKIKDIPDFIF